MNPSDQELDASDIARRIDSLTDLAIGAGPSDCARYLLKCDYFWDLAESKGLEKEVDTILKAKWAPQSA